MPFTHLKENSDFFFFLQHFLPSYVFLNSVGRTCMRDYLSRTTSSGVRPRNSRRSASILPLHREVKPEGVKRGLRPGSAFAAGRFSAAVRRGPAVSPIPWWAAATRRVASGHGEN